MSLRYPDMRRELLLALDLLAESRPADPSYGQSGPGGSLFSDIFELILDDLDFARDPEGGVGYFVIDLAEAQAVAALVPLLRAVFEEAGADARDEEYQSTPSWPRLVSAAQHARAVMKERSSADGSAPPP